ncbi:MAG: hypothetical protein NTX97_01325, partial [Bacteroidetes bacterium]|nr:hypothetical protein [Bacteroidota bacterium]
LEMEYHQFSMYAFSGFGMCLINIIFLLNTFIPIHSTTLSFDIVTYKTGNQGVEITLSGEGNSSALERNVASYFGDNYRALFKAKKITVYTSTGIFGMDRIKDCEFVY